MNWPRSDTKLQGVCELFYCSPTRRLIFGFDSSTHVRRHVTRNYFLFFENCYLRSSFNCRYKVSANRQLGVELPEHVSRGAGSVQQARAMPGAGGVGHSELQPKTVSEDRLHEIAKGPLPGWVSHVIHRRDRLLFVQVSKWPAAVMTGPAWFVQILVNLTRTRLVIGLHRWRFQTLFVYAYI